MSFLAKRGLLKFVY